MATMNISLPDQMKAWVEERAAGGRYANSSDLVRDLIRREQERLEAVAELQALVDEAMADPMPTEPFDFDEFLREMHEGSDRRRRDRKLA